MEPDEHEDEHTSAKSCIITVTDDMRSAKNTFTQLVQEKNTTFGHLYNEVVNMSVVEAISFDDAWQHTMDRWSHNFQIFAENFELSHAYCAMHNLLPEEDLSRYYENFHKDHCFATSLLINNSIPSRDVVHADM
jgi:hypothetical protein